MDTKCMVYTHAHTYMCMHAHTHTCSNARVLVPFRSYLLTS